MAATRAVSVRRIFLPDNGKPCQLILCEVLRCNDLKECFQKLHLNYDSGGEVHYINQSPPYIPYSGNKVYYNILLDDRAGLSAAYEILYETKERIKNGKV